MQMSIVSPEGFLSHYANRVRILCVFLHVDKTWPGGYIILGGWSPIMVVNHVQAHELNPDGGLIGQMGWKERCRQGGGTRGVFLSANNRFLSCHQEDGRAEVGSRSHSEKCSGGAL